MGDLDGSPFFYIGYHIAVIIWKSSARMGYDVTINMTEDNQHNLSTSSNARNPFETAAAEHHRGQVAAGMSSHADNAALRGSKHGGRRVASSIIITLLVAVVAAGGSLFIGHQRLVATCSDVQEAYQQQVDQLQELLDDKADLLDITTDDVLDEDKSVVNDFQTAYKQAKEELEDKAISDDQCTSGKQNDELREATANLASAAATLSDLAYQVDGGAENVQLANQIKLLSDARSALNSTMLSAQALSQNQSLSSDVRSQLSRAVSLASNVLETNDLDDIQDARDQLDDIIDEVNDQLLAANQELLDIEAAVSQIATYADDSGSYVSLAMDILSAANLQPVWGLNKMRGACSITNEQASSWLAAFCSATPGYIYINDTLSGDVTGDAYFADAMRHEIAHYLIYRRCGTSDPASIGNLANAESTASSYAVLYLGANAQTLNRAADSRYHMNTASDEAAARIHAGQCY